MCPSVQQEGNSQVQLSAQCMQRVRQLGLKRWGDRWGNKELKLDGMLNLKDFPLFIDSWKLSLMELEAIPSLSCPSLCLSGAMGFKRSVQIETLGHLQTMILQKISDIWGWKSSSGRGESEYSPMFMCPEPRSEVPDLITKLLWGRVCVQDFISGHLEQSLLMSFHLDLVLNTH